MKILKAKLESGIGRAEEYRLLGKNHPEGLKVHIQYIKDLIKPLIVSLRCQLTPDEEAENSKLLAAAKTTLKNLQSEIATAEHGVICPAISKIREKLESSSGQKLPSFGGYLFEFDKFLTSFSHSISMDLSISDTEKLIILKSCLIAEPFNFVDAFPPSSTNYSLALRLLEQVYSNKYRGVTQHLYRRLNNLPQVSMNDGAKFQETYLELESILQSMGKSEHNINVNEDLGVKFLYLRKFTEKTLCTVLAGETDMSLPEIRREIRHLINVNELYSLAGDAADNLEGSVSSEENPTVSLISPNPSANIDGHGDTAGVTASRNTDNVKISLMTEDAAKRLGIHVPPEKTLRLCTSDSNFTATVKNFSLRISVGTSDEYSVSVHIVDKTFSAQVVPGVDIDDFVKIHPKSSRLQLPDTGKGRPIDIFLCDCYYKPFMTNRGLSFKLKANWRLQKNLLGWLVRGPVKKNYRQISYSYRFPENYEVPYSELSCQRV